MVNCSLHTSFTPAPSWGATAPSSFGGSSVGSTSPVAVAMGGNVWEWIKDRKDNSALTAGSSWWYSSSNTTKSGAQFKAADFYAIYVGFRCAFEK